MTLPSPQGLDALWARDLETPGARLLQADQPEMDVSGGKMGRRKGRGRTVQLRKSGLGLTAGAHHQGRGLVAPCCL